MSVGPKWLMPLHLEHGHTSSVFMVAKLKKRQAKPNPNDLQLRTLSVGPNRLMPLHLEHGHTGSVFMVAK